MWMKTVLAGLVGLAVSLASAPNTALAQAKTPLKIVLNRNTSNLVPYIAADQKLFEKYGVTADISVVSSGAESNELLASGRMDGGTLGLGTAVIAWANGQTIIPVVKYRDGADVYSVIARKGIGITSIKDLKGKTVAVTKGTDPETAFILALKANGLSTRDVRIIDSKWADHAALLERGDIDAANANEPFGTKILKSIPDKVTLVERLTPYYGNGGVMVLREQVLKDNPEAARGVVLAFWEAHKIIREQPEIAIASLKKWLQLDDETASDTLKFFGARPLLTEQTSKDLQTNIDLLVEGKKIRSKPDVAKFMNPGIALQKILMTDPNYGKLLPQS